MDFTKLRHEMVVTQIESRGVSDKRLLDALRKVPREKFVGGNLQNRAYEDCPLPISEGQTISQPYMVAFMTELLCLKGNEKVLDVGTGSGYHTAILAELSREVYSLERHEILLAKAGHALVGLGYRNVHLFAGDGTLGLKEFAPYDRIIVTAASKEIPLSLTEQLADHGILVMPVGSAHSQDLKVLRKDGGIVTVASKGGCVFVPLIGKYGCRENEN